MGRHSCCYKQSLKKGLWSPEEDEKLFNCITRYGVGRWSSVPKRAGLQRCGKSCRLRWINYLRPDLKRGSFTRQEEDLIMALHQLLGNRWSKIASQLPGRTDNEVKNFWNSSLRKRLRQLGIDPRTHRPWSQEERPDDEKAAFCDPFPSLGPPTHLPWTAPVNLHQYYQLRQNLVASDPTHLPAATDFEPAAVVASGGSRGWFDSAVVTGASDGHGNGGSSSSGSNGGGNVGFQTHVVMEKHRSFEYWETGRDPLMESLLVRPWNETAGCTGRDLLMESLLARPWNETAGCTSDLSAEGFSDDLRRLELEYCELQGIKFIPWA